MKGTLGVVEQVLEKAKKPLSVREIVKTAGEMLPTSSRQPSNVVHRDLSVDVKKEGSKFVRTAPGTYSLRQYADQLLH